MMHADGSADEGHTLDDDATAIGLGANVGHTQDEEANCNRGRLGAVRLFNGFGMIGMNAAGLMLGTCISYSLRERVVRVNIYIYIYIYIYISRDTTVLLS